MKISEAKKLKFGDRVYYDGEGMQDSSSYGIVIDTGYAGVNIRWQDQKGCHALFSEDAAFWELITKVDKIP